MGEDVWYTNSNDITFKCINDANLATAILSNLDLIRSMGIKHVIGASCINDINILSNALVIGNINYSTAGEKKNIYLPIYRKPYISDAVFPDGDANIIVLYDLTAIAKMYFAKNVIVLSRMVLYESDIEDATIFIKTILTLLKLAKEKSSIDDFIYYPGYELRWIMESFTPDIPLPKINTSSCKGTLVIDNDGIEYTKEFELVIDKYYDHMEDAVVYLAKPLIFKGVLAILYDARGHFENAYVDDYTLTIDNVELRHPNIADSGKVCTGDYHPGDLDFGEEICKQLDDVANQIIEILKTPSTNAYNNKLFEYVYEKGLIERKEKVFTS